jgi:hypothetical protein
MPRRQQPPVEPVYPSMDDDHDSEAAEDADDFAASMNDDQAVDLSDHEPPPIGGGFGAPPALGLDYGFGQYGSTAPQAAVGRPTSPPIWNNAHLFPSVTQLRVWKVVNGNPVLVGLIDAKANEEEFIQEFLPVMPSIGESPAKFMVRPVDRQGKEVREEIELPPIDPQHTILRRFRAAHNAQNPIPIMPTPTQDTSPLMLKLVDVLERRVDRSEREAEEERKRLAEERAELARRHVEIADRTNMATEAVTERLMNQEATRNERILRQEQERADERARRDREYAAQQAELERVRNEQTSTTLATLFQQSLNAQQQASERDRQAYERRVADEEARRRRDQEEYDRRMERERREAEDKRERERLEWEQKWAKERQEAEDRREREKREATERERERENERQRQHDLRMKEMELTAQRDREHAERMMALNTSREKGESIEGLLERGTKLLTMFGLKPAELVEKLTKEDDSTGEIVSTIGNIVATGIKTFGEVMKARQAATPAVQGMLPNYLPPQPAPAPGQAPGQPPQAQAPNPQQSTQAQAPTPTPEVVTPKSSLPLPVQRNARNALRTLVQELRRKPESEWIESITLAVTGEMAIYPYCKDVTLRAALLEAGAEPDIVARVLMHEAMNLIPNDVPRG